jgi:hypothetical protein
MLIYVHQQLILSKTSSKSITLHMMAIINVKCISSGARIRVTEAQMLLEKTLFS